MAAAPSPAYRDDRAHVFHSWSAQATLDPTVFTGAEGSWLWDEHGNRFLDLSSQLIYMNVGHQHPRVVEAIKSQADTLCVIAPAHANPARSELARLLAEQAPGDLDTVFFTNGGAEAVENAVRMARLHTGRAKVFAAYHSYHGATAGAIALTGEPRRWQSEPSVPGVVHFWGPYRYRSSFHADDDATECARALEHLRAMIAVEGPDQIAAIIMESVVGTNGVLVPPDGYLAGIRALCDEFGIVMICDEVMAGFGRCGEWFAVDHWDVTPDLITFAKGVTSGTVPLGGVLISRVIAETFAERAYPGGLTYSGHPLACAAGVATLGVYRDEQLIERARTLGVEVIAPGLAELAGRHPSVGEVRGLGAFWAIELVRDPVTREPLIPFGAQGAATAPMRAVAAACRERGALGFFPGNRIHLAPPLTISHDDLRLGLEVIDAALEVADRWVGA